MINGKRNLNSLYSLTKILANELRLNENRGSRGENKDRKLDHLSIYEEGKSIIVDGTTLLIIDLFSSPRPR